VTTLFASAALLPDGLASAVKITLDNGRIVDIEVGASPAHADEHHALIFPGIANLHSHAFQRAMAGLAERRGPGEDSFWSWRAAMYRFALAMTPEDVEAVAAQLYVEMLEAGFTRVGEFHYLHHDQSGLPYAHIAEMAERIGAASVEAGIGLTLLPVFYAHAGFGLKPPSEGQRRFIHDRDGFAALMAASAKVVAGISGANLGVAPHSLRAAALPEIHDVVALPHDGPVHIHIAEQVLEVEECLAATGARPLELLLANAEITERWCLIHATHLADDEVNGMVRSGAVAGLCPITEANLGDGIFKGEEYCRAGGVFGVGSDSNVQISLAGELRQFEYSQRLRQRSRNVLAHPGGSTGEALVLGAAIGGGRALGVEAGIRKGAIADLVSIDTNAVRYLPHENLLDAFVFGSGAEISDVWVSGRKRVSNGRHPHREAIRRRFEEAMARLVSR
jgi:formiminoglutamate deiminase